MLVWLIKIGEPIPMGSGVRHLRTMMLAEALSKRGHSVVWWTSTFDHFSKKHLFEDNEIISFGSLISVHMIKGIAYHNNVSLKRYLDHWLVAKKFRKRAIRFPRPDVVVVSMPDYQLAAAAVEYSKENNVPVIMDIRDKWPDFIWKILPPVISLFVRLLLYRDRKILALALKKSDGIVAVSQAWLQWALSQTGRLQSKWDRVFYLGAHSHQRNINSLSNAFFQEIINQTKGKLVVSYIGSFTRIHSPEIIIRSARLIKDHPELSMRFCFILAGDGPLRKKMEKISSELRNVFFTGWLTKNEISSLLDHSHFGVVPSGFKMDLFPNKAFTFLSAGVPVLTGQDGDLPELLENYKAGCRYKYNDPDNFLEKLVSLSEKETHAEYQANASFLFDKLCNADNIYEVFAQYVESVATAKRFEKQVDLKPILS